MTLSGGNYGGFEIINNEAVFEDIVISVTAQGGLFNVDGWLYNADGVFVGTE